MRLGTSLPDLTLPPQAQDVSNTKTGKVSLGSTSASDKCDVASPQTRKVPLDISGFQLSNLKVDHLARAELNLDIDLKPGKIALPGRFCHASAVVGQGNHAHGTFRLKKDDKGMLKVEHAKIELDEPIVVKNPSAFLRGGSSRWAKLKGWVVDRTSVVEIRKVEVLASGEVILSGSLKVMACKHFDLSKLLGAFMPRMNLDVKDLASAQKSKVSEGMNAREFVDVLAKMVGTSRFHVDAELEESQKDRARFQLHGQCAFDDKSNFHAQTDSQKSTVDCALGHVQMDASLNVERNTNDKALKVGFDIEASLTQGRDVESNGQRFGFGEGQIRGVGSAQIDVSSGLALLGAQGSVSAQVKNPRARVRGLDLHLDGKLNAGLIAHRVKKGDKDAGQSTKGAFRFGTSLGQSETAAEFEVYDDGKAKMSLVKNGLKEVLEPMVPLSSYPGKLVDVTQKPQGALGSSELRAHIEKVTKTVIRPGNRVKILVDGKSSYPTRLKLIADAKESICWQALTFKDDTSGMVLAKALADAQKRGVKVRVIVDALGNSDHLRAMHKTNQALALMKSAGVDVQIHNNEMVAGLAQMYAVAQKHSNLFDYDKVKGFEDKVAMMALFAELCAVANRTSSIKLPIDDEAELVAGLNLIANSDAIKRSKDKSIDLASMVSLMEQIGSGAHSWHEKYVIVDGLHAIVGGMNTADCYMYGGDTYMNHDGKTKKGWRDTDLLMTGPAVFDAHRAFAKNWAKVAGEKLVAPLSVEELGKRQEGDGLADVQVIQHSPKAEGDHHITNFLIENLKALQRGDKAYFENAYFLPTGVLEPLKQALIDAAKRGVDVRVLTNSKASTDAPSVNQAAVSAYRELLSGGVRIFERADERTIHSKIASLGGKVAVIGSSNLDNRSGMINSEVIAAVHNDAVAKELCQVIEADMAKDVAREVKLSDIATLPIVEEIGQAMALSLGDLL